jgi:hypothetical protein
MRSSTRLRSRNNSESYIQNSRKRKSDQILCFSNNTTESLSLNEVNLSTVRSNQNETGTASQVSTVDSAISDLISSPPRKSIGNHLKNITSTPAARSIPVFGEASVTENRQVKIKRNVI